MPIHTLCQALFDIALFNIARSQFRLVLLFFLLLLFAVNSQAANSSAMVLVDPERASALQKSMGYLLVSLDVSGTAPSLKLFKISSDPSSIGRSDYARLLRSAKKTSKKITLNLKDKKQGFYVLPLPRGVYQITRVSAPYFDLPYLMATDNTRDWRFVIEEGRLNYIGNLYIAKERTSKNITAKLQNRLASELSEINRSLSSLIKVTPLAIGVGVRDDYYRDLLQNAEQK